MAEPDRWQTVRKCPECYKLGRGKEIYLYAQAWGKNEEGEPVIKLDCLECGHHEPLTTWRGL